MKIQPIPIAEHIFDFFSRAKKWCLSLGVAAAGIGLVGFAQAATDFCQQTAQFALDACQDAAQSGRSVAVGKCGNISDAAARSDCRQQATQDFRDALQTCQDGYASRQAACHKFGPARYDPVIDPTNFMRHVTNPFFPLPPGQTFVYEGQTKDGFVHNDFIVTHKTKLIMGVIYTEVHHVVYLGDFYRQEFSLANAEDNALVVSLNATVTVPPGKFTHCLKTLETTPLEPDARENKYYASGVGNVLTVDLETGEKSELVKIHANDE